MIWPFSLSHTGHAFKSESDTRSNHLNYLNHLNRWSYLNHLSRWSRWIRWSRALLELILIHSCEDRGYLFIEAFHRQCRAYYVNLILNLNLNFFFFVENDVDSSLPIMLWLLAITIAGIHQRSWFETEIENENSQKFWLETYFFYWH